MAKPRTRSSYLRSEALFLDPHSRRGCSQFSSLKSIYQIANSHRWLLSLPQEKSLAVTLGGRAGIFIATDGLWVVDVEL
jgi:hypothetical protein